MALLAHSDLHIWDNAAFDVSGASCSASPALLPNPRSADENLSPNFSNSPPSSSVVVAGKKQPPPPPFSTPNQYKPLKLLFKQGLLSPARRPETDDDESIVDSEIESIMKEIARLSARLEALRSRKKDAHRETDPVIRVERPSGPHGVQVVANAATTTAPLKQSTKTTKTVRVCAPPETAKPRERGVSMCPSEIHGGTRLMLQPENSQSRRKSCFWKNPLPLEEEEAKVGRVRAHRLSLAGGAKNGSRTLSPKSRLSKLTDLRRGIVTVGSKSNNLAEKEEAATSRLQPKKLFGDANPPSAPKSLKNARVVPSRYNQIPATTTTAGRAAAARNSPEKERRQKKEMRRKSQGRQILIGAGDACGRRKRWGPSDDERSSVSSCTTESLALEEVAVALPKIKAVRLVGESPRDSGCAKRAADLVGKRTYFSCETAAAEDDSVTPICLVLDYDDDDDDDDASP